jgi:hypothetical protein
MWKCDDMKYFAVCHECGKCTQKENKIRPVRKWAEAHEHEVVMYRTKNKVSNKVLRRLPEILLFVSIEIIVTVVRKAVFKF